MYVDTNVILRFMYMYVCICACKSCVTRYIHTYIHSYLGAHGNHRVGASAETMTEIIATTKAAFIPL